MSELDRRAFLERMRALGAAAVVAPASLGSRTRYSEAAAGRPRPLPDPRSLERLLGGADPRQATRLTELTLVEAAALLRRDSVSPTELLDACLDRIGRWDAQYRAFNAVPADVAREVARRAARQERRGALWGIPLAIKDNFFTAGVPTTANSILFRDFVPDFDATAWARLRGAGAILLGKTQMGPLATTPATTPTGEPTTVNAWAPHDREVSPGGSSSGSATAVAGRLAPSSTGTQTGGSITNPASEQGLTGLKPTMGRVSLHGIIPLTYTRDHPGPVARDARDAALMLQIMAGPDPADPRSLGLPPVPDYLRAVEGPAAARGRSLGRPTRIGVWPGYLDEPGASTEDPGPADPREREIRRARLRARREALQAEVAARRTLLADLERLGAELVELEEPRDWETLTSRAFNDVRLPERSELFLEQLRDDVRGFGVSLAPWINGLLLPAAEYVRGQRARWILLRRILDDVFSRCDVVVQTEPFPFDMVGLPLVAFPIGFEEASAGIPLPVAAMFGAPPYEEDRLLALAGAYQRVTDWHRRRPEEPDAFERRGRPDDPPRRLGLFDVVESGE